MRKLDVSSIVNGTIGMPVKAGTWQHLQNAYTELLNELANEIYTGMDNTKVNVLRGISYIYIPPIVFPPPGFPAVYVIPSGAILYEGEIFLVPNQAVFPSLSNLVVALVNAQYTATDSGGYPTGDPVLFSNNQYYNIMNIRTMVVCESSAVPTGATVVCNYSELVYQSPVAHQSDITTLGNQITALSSTDTYHYVYATSSTDTLASQLLNSWQVPNTDPVLGVIKESSLLSGSLGRVQFNGGIQFDTAYAPSSGQPAFVLPVNYRPNRNMEFLAFSTSFGSFFYYTVTIEPSGNVVIGFTTAPSGSFNTVWLDNISFIAWQ